MKKIKKRLKFSINTLLLLFDIPVVLFLINNNNNNAADAYLGIRLMMMGIVMIKITLKLFKTSFISLKKANLFKTIFSFLNSDDDYLDVSTIFNNLNNIFMLNIESMLLLGIFMLTLGRFESTLIMSNTWTMFISLVSLNTVLVLIRIYIDKRCEMLINLIQKKENLNI